MKKLVVAIDGPAGAGKSTVAQLAAKELGYTYIDTGAMYRAVAWKVLQQGGEVTDEKILAVVPDIDVDLSYENGKTTVRVDGQDVTSEIRTPEVSHIVSKVAALGPCARRWSTCSARWQSAAACSWTAATSRRMCCRALMSRST